MKILGYMNIIKHYSKCIVLSPYSNKNKANMKIGPLVYGVLPLNSHDNFTKLVMCEEHLVTICTNYWASIIYEIKDVQYYYVDIISIICM